MPLFEYHCDDCATDFEVLVRSSSDGQDAPPCPSCGGRNTAKQFSTFAATVSKGAPDMGACQMPGCGAPMPGGCGSGMCDLE